MATPQFVIYPNYEEFHSLFSKSQSSKLKGMTGLYKDYLRVLHSLEQIAILKKGLSIDEIKNQSIKINLRAHFIGFETQQLKKTKEERRKINEATVRILVNKLRETSK
jgi:hypothetical protein